MRIIGGLFKSRSLVTLPDKTIRPTTDRVKESIFNLLQFNVKNSVVLDLFAGSGAIGIECISRGASKVYFVDKSKLSIEVVNENLKKVSGNYEIINRDFRQAISLLKAREKFDIIFLDPPYAEGLETEILSIIMESQILSDNGIIVLERDRNNNSYNVADDYGVFDSRDYGGTTIDIIKKMTKVAITGTFDPFTLGHKFLVEKALENYDKAYVCILNNPQKQPLLKVDKRVEIIKKSLKEYSKRVEIDCYEGLTIDYCHKKSIKTIVRGVRCDADIEYEKEMADYNFTNGGIKTIFYSADKPIISATLVREKLKNGEDISEYVDERVINLLQKEAKKWKI